MSSPLRRIKAGTAFYERLSYSPIIREGGGVKISIHTAPETSMVSDMDGVFHGKGTPCANNATQAALHG